MRSKFFTAIILFFLSNYPFQNSDANAILHLKGKIISFDENIVTLETPKSIYRIDRKSLSKTESDHITKSGIETTLSVPMTAIKTVKNNSKK